LTPQVLDRVSFPLGYVSALAEWGEPQRGILAPGSQNLLAPAGHRLEAFRGLANPVTGGRVLFNFSDTYASLNDYNPGGGAVAAKGSVFMLQAGRTLGFIGAGQVYYSSASMGVAATSTLQYLLYRNGTYNGSAANGPFQAGHAAPSAPGLLPMTSTLSTPGKVSGAVAVRLTRVSSATGGESNASTSSAVVIANQQSIRIGPFPALDSNGQDRWGVYVTLPGFGLKGPFYFLVEIPDTALSTIGGVARSYQVEWTEADLSSTELLAPIDNYPPPPGVFACELGGHVAVIGCYGDVLLGATAAQPGNAIAISLQGQPEAFPPTADYILFLPEPPLFVLSRAADGYVYIFCKNSTHVLSYTGGTPPLALQTVLPNTGIAGPHAACVADGVLYMATAQGLLRVNAAGQVETEWAARLAEARGFVASDVALGFDGAQKILAIAHGNTVYPYNTATDKFWAPIPLSAAPVSVSGSVVAAVTVLNALKLSVNNAGAFTLYDFNRGTTGSVWVAQTGVLDGGAPGFQKTITTVRAALRHDDLTHPTVTTRLYRSLQAGSVFTPALAKQFTHTITFTGEQSLKPPRLNVRGLKGYSIWQSGQGLADSVPLEILVEGVVNGTRV
jgi:hypothetical protein